MSTPQPPAGAPEAPAAEATPPVKGNGFGVAALVLGILAIAFAFVPFASYGAVVAGVAAAVLGILGLLKKNRPHGTSIAGLIIGVIGFILALVMTLLYAAIFFGVSNTIHEEQKAAATSHTVVYTVTGAAQDADITYTTFTNDNFGTQESSSTPLPFTKSITVKGSTDSFSFNSFTLTAINGVNDTGAISCSITVDGKAIASQTSTGSLADVTCSGSN